MGSSETGEVPWKQKGMQQGGGSCRNCSFCISFRLSKILCLHKSRKEGFLRIPHSFAAMLVRCGSGDYWNGFAGGGGDRGYCREAAKILFRTIGSNPLAHCFCVSLIFDRTAHILNSNKQIFF